MTRQQAFELAAKIAETEGWAFFGIEPRQDGRFLVKAIFAGQHGATFHSLTDFLDCPWLQVDLAQLVKPQIATAQAGDMATMRALRNGNH